MQFTVPVILGLMSLGMVAHAAPMQEAVVLYECQLAKSVPKIDGLLDDEAWQGVTRADLPYKFFAMTPTPGKGKSWFKMAYDESALYLAATFYRDGDKPLRTNYMALDAPNLWMDDSAEIYISPTCDGRLYKFIVNSVAVVADMKMGHGQGVYLDYSYDAVNTRVRTTVNKETWVLEMAIPWGDLFVDRPLEGDLWAFELLAFTGKERGSWTVGAVYSRPERFGFISFSRSLSDQIGNVAAHVALAKGERWRMITEGGVLVYNSWSVALDLALGRAAKQLATARSNVRVIENQKTREALLQKLKPLQESLDQAAAAEDKGVGKRTALEVEVLLHRLDDIERQARQVRFEARIQEMIAALKK